MKLTGILLAADSKALQTTVIVLACVLGVLAVVYGAIKKFSRSSWMAWQLPLAFAGVQLLQKLPDSLTGWTRQGVGLGIVVGIPVLILGIGALIRGLMRRRTQRACGFVRFGDRFLGSVTALLGFAVLFAVLAGYAFHLMEPWGVIGDRFGEVTGRRAVSFLIDSSPDLVTLALLMYALKGGYRLGVTRALWTIVALVCVFGAFVGAFLLTVRVSFFAGLAQKLSAAFSGLRPMLADILGHGIIMLVLFLLFFAVIMLLFYLFHRLIVRRLDRVTALRVMGGALMGLLFAAIFLAFVFGLIYGLETLLKTMAEMPDPPAQLASVADKLDTVLSSMFYSSPLTRFLAEYNPLRFLLG